MACIADANVLFPLLVKGHAAHEVATAWWSEQADATVATCLLTRLAVLRLLTNRAAMNGAPVSPNEALKAWRRLSDDPRSFYIDTQSTEHETRFTSFVSSREPTPNLWTDAWLAALALSLDYEMTTFDRGFKSFRGLKLRLLQINDA
jgi:toxin-antitoxin system PIN domain toxin